MSTAVSPQYLLEGAVYALEQCRLLLRDANLLYRNRSYASAVALAAIAREELGRWKILLRLRKKVVGGEKLAIKEIKVQCDNHVAKQKAGVLSLTVRGNRNSGPGKLLAHRMKAALGSKERIAADKQVEELDRVLTRRTADDRHRQRMSALYVDALSHDRWNRPAKGFSQEIAHDFLQDAANDYSLQRSQGYIHLEFVALHNSELAKALAEWSDRPELPPPEWPRPVIFEPGGR